MTSTKPVGPSTGQGHPGCFAHPLKDCGRIRSKGGTPSGKTAPNLEHYVSRCLLERVERTTGTMRVEGLSRSQGQLIEITNPQMTARVLCPRHNHALNPTDTAICALYDELDWFHQGRHDGWRDIDGNALELWAIKVMTGMLVSGNLHWPGREGEKMEDVPIEMLNIIFGETEIADGCGFFFSFIPPEQMGDEPDPQVQLQVLPYPDDDPTDARKVMGIEVRILGFRFTVAAFARLQSNARALWHRPLGFLFGPNGGIRLRWNLTNSTAMVGLSTSREVRIVSQGIT